VNRLTVDTYLKRWKAVQDAYDEECEGIIDMTESTVLKAIKEGDVGTAKWYLAHKAKSRGYVSRQEVTGADGGELIKVVLKQNDTPDNS
jgi:hypothetical protein